jgi:hypothetical protein
VFPEVGDGISPSKYDELHDVLGRLVTDSITIGSDMLLGDRQYVFSLTVTDWLGAMHSANMSVFKRSTSIPFVQLQGRAIHHMYVQDDLTKPATIEPSPCGGDSELEIRWSQNDQDQTVVEFQPGSARLWCSSCRATL